MSKSIQFAALIFSSLGLATPARAEIYPALQQWLDGMTDRTHKWQDCLKDATQATGSNPFFKFNPSTDDPKFSCRQVGPHILTTAPGPGRSPGTSSTRGS